MAGRLDAKDLPRAWHALELVRAPTREGKSRSRDQVSYRAGDQDFVWPRQAHDARPDVYGDPGDPCLHYVELTGVEAGAHLDAKLVYALDNRECAADGARGPVENRKEAIASPIDLLAAKTSELA